MENLSLVLLLNAATVSRILACFCWDVASRFGVWFSAVMAIVQTHCARRESKNIRHKLGTIDVRIECLCAEFGLHRDRHTLARNRHLACFLHYPSSTWFGEDNTPMKAMELLWRLPSTWYNPSKTFPGYPAAKTDGEKGLSSSTLP